MRFITTFVLATTLALPALAQTTPTRPHHAMRHPTTTSPRETVNDKGPFTPEANAAYNGGGVVLESAPGGPPPPASAILGSPAGQPLPPR